MSNLDLKIVIETRGLKPQVSADDQQSADMSSSKHSFPFVALTHNKRPMNLVLIPIAMYTLLLAALQSGLYYSGSTICEIGSLPQWTSYFTFSEILIFCLAIALQLMKFRESFKTSNNYKSLRPMYWLSIAIFSFSLSTSILRFTNHDIFCRNYFGLVLPTSLWIEWLVCSNAILRIIFLANNDAMVSRSFFQLSFCFNVSIICGLILQFSTTPWHGYLCLILCVISFVIACIVNYKLDRPKNLTSILPVVMNSETRYLDELEWDYILKNMKFFLHKVIFLFVIAFILGLTGVFDPGQTFASLIVCNIYANFGFVSIISDEFKSLTDSLTSVITANYISNASRSQFLRYIFHEIRNPLNSMSLGLVTLTDAPLNENEREAVLIMKDSVNYMSDTLNDVLSMHKIEEGMMKIVILPFKLNDSISVVTRAVKLHAENSRVTMFIKILESLPATVQGDRHRFEHAFINMLTYFIKLSPENSVMYVNLFPEISRNSTTTRSIVQIKVMMEVSELSVSFDDVMAMFQPFNKLRTQNMQMESGTGLGLALARDIIELHGGSMCFVAKDQENDATMGFQIPFEIVADGAALIAPFETVVGQHPKHARAPSENTMADITSAIAIAAAIVTNRYLAPEISDANTNYDTDSSLPERRQKGEGGKHIYGNSSEVSLPSLAAMYSGDETFTCLVVDDALSNRKMLSLALKGKSISSDMAENGLMSCEAITKNPDKYSIIFMDNTMPIMTGIEATKEIRSLGFDKLIMGLTGNALHEDITAFLNAGADIVLTKPLRAQQIDAILRFARANGFFTGGPRTKLALASNNEIERYSVGEESYDLISQNIAMSTLSNHRERTVKKTKRSFKSGGSPRARNTTTTSSFDNPKSVQSVAAAFEYMSSHSSTSSTNIKLFTSFQKPRNISNQAVVGRDNFGSATLRPEMEKFIPKSQRIPEGNTSNNEISHLMSLNDDSDCNNHVVEVLSERRVPDKVSDGF